MTPSLLPKYCHLTPGMFLRFDFITCRSPSLIPFSDGLPFCMGGGLPNRHPVAVSALANTKKNNTFVDILTMGKHILVLGAVVVVVVVVISAESKRKIIRSIRTGITL